MPLRPRALRRGLFEAPLSQFVLGARPVHRRWQLQVLRRLGALRLLREAVPARLPRRRALPGRRGRQRHGRSARRGRGPPARHVRRRRMRLRLGLGWCRLRGDDVPGAGGRALLGPRRVQPIERPVHLPSGMEWTGLRLGRVQAAPLPQRRPVRRYAAALPAFACTARATRAVSCSLPAALDLARRPALTNAACSRA